MLSYFDISAPDPPIGWGGGPGRGLTKNIDFLDSSWNVWHLKFLPIKLPTPGGVGWDYFFVITFLGSSWNFPDFWNVDPQPPPPESPGVGWVKQICIAFLDSSWHFPDFWFFDPLKFQPLGLGDQFFLGRNHSQIYPHMRAKCGHDQSQTYFLHSKSQCPYHTGSFMHLCHPELTIATRFCMEYQNMPSRSCNVCKTRLPVSSHVRQSTAA